MTNQCSVDDCDKPARIRGWCGMHHQRFIRHGSIDVVLPRGATPMDEIGNRYGRLTVIGEGPRHHGRPTWLCDCDCGGQTSAAGKHLRNGAVKSCGCLRAETLKNGREARSNVVGYLGAHWRIYDLRGRAADHDCVDCGESARHWSYDHLDPDERYEPRCGAYSCDPNHYVPRCAKCHKAFDRAITKGQPA